MSRRYSAVAFVAAAVAAVLALTATPTLAGAPPTTVAPTTTAAPTTTVAVTTTLPPFEPMVTVTVGSSGRMAFWTETCGDAAQIRVQPAQVVLTMTGGILYEPPYDEPLQVGIHVTGDAIGGAEYVMVVPFPPGDLTMAALDPGASANLALQEGNLELTLLDY